MRIGVQLPEVERDVRWPEYRAMARAAEQVGFGSIWVGDHLLYRDDRPERGPWDAWTLLSALAVATERVRLGPLVACAAFHPPGVLARMAAGVNELSDGRFVLGIGAGWNENEFRAFGIPFDRRVARFEEAFEIVRRLLGGERVTFEGRFHRVEEAVLLPRPRSRPELMIGSNGERMLRAALPHADTWNTWFDGYGNRAEGFAKLNARITELAVDVGRRPEDVRRSACVLVVLDRTTGERSIPDGVAPLEGSPGHIAEELRELAEAGVQEAILVLSPIAERSIRSLEEVASAFGDA